MSYIFPRIPVGEWIAYLLDIVVETISPVTRAFADIVGIGIDGVEHSLLFLPPPLLIGVFVLCAWFATRKKGLPWLAIAGLLLLWLAETFAPVGGALYTFLAPVFVVTETLPPLVLVALGAVFAWVVLKRAGLASFTLMGFLLIWSMEFWPAAMSTLSLVLVATLLAVLIGVPLGILAGISRPVFRCLSPVLDLMQTMPSFVYLIPTIPLFGLGKVAAVFATLIFALPPAIRMTCLGIRQVPEDLVECCEAFGATRWQRLVKVELPLAAPTILAGINQTVMLALSMVVVAAMIGAKGLGGEVWRAIQRLNVGLGFEAGLGIVIIAIFLDRILQQIGLRSAKHTKG